MKSLLNTRAFLTAIGLVAASFTVKAVGPILQVSSDPYTNSTSQHKSEVEPHTFAYGSTIISSFQVGRFYDGGASDLGWATSNDNGKTWDHGFLPGITKYEGGGSFDRVSDASTAYDRKHGVWLISSLPIQEQGSDVLTSSVVVSRSVDGGHHWENPVTIATGSSPDKNWTVCDNTETSPYYGNCYTEWDDGSNTFYMNTSTDGGLTWGPSMPISGSTGLGGQPVVQPNGRVIVPALGGQIIVFSSGDGGASWSGTSTIADLNEFENPGNIRAESLPSAAVDAAGHVYVVWADCRFEANCSANDIVMSTSDDGVNWTSPVRIPTSDVGSGIDSAIPGIGVDMTTSGANAHLVLTYYYFANANCTADTCDLNVATVTSTDGGQHWSPFQNLAGPMKLSWLPMTSQGSMVGDYISTAVSNGVGFSVFAVANPSGQTGFDQAMYAPTAGIVIRGGTRAVQELPPQHRLAQFKPHSLKFRTAR